jgi:hypothetical protein
MRKHPSHRPEDVLARREEFTKLHQRGFSPSQISRKMLIHRATVVRNLKQQDQVDGSGLTFEEREGIW